MTDQDLGSPWSRESHATPPTAPAPAGQPSHAWLSAETYATASAHPGAYAAPPASTVPPVQVHVTAPPSGGRGLAVLGVVLGGLALLGLPLVFILSLGVMGDPGSGAGYGSLTGKLSPTKGALDGTALAGEITKQVTDQGGEPEDVTCPQTLRVGQDVTTVCHGSDYGDDVSFVILFEDEEGSYTLLEV